jgi:hypothetical protein
MIFKILLLFSIFSLVGCNTVATKNDLSEISDLRKCTSLAYSYKNIGRNLELDNDLIAILKKQEANLNCSKYSKSQILEEAEINIVLSRLNYDAYFRKNKEIRKNEFLASAKQCINKVEEEYINLSKKFPNLKNHYFDKPSKKTSDAKNLEVEKQLILKSGNKYFDNIFNDLDKMADNIYVDINSHLSIVDLEIMRCISDDGFCAHNDGVLEYAHAKKTGRIWDGKNFVSKSTNLCVPDYCRPVNADLIMDVYPSLNSVLNLCNVK